MPNTPRLALPYPTLSDTADVPRDISALATKLDTGATIYSQGLNSARPAAGMPGRFYFATDLSVLYYDNGTAWVGAGATGGSGQATVSVLDVGLQGQYRAGRQFTATDFTTVGLAPSAVWNLSDVSAVVGAALTNKAVPAPVAFVPGINGLATTAAQFRGPDATPANTPVLHTTGSTLLVGTIGCWFRTPKRGTVQAAATKWGAAGTLQYWLGVSTGNTVLLNLSADGTAVTAFNGLTDVCDDRWHFVVAVWDGSAVRIYVDGVLENQTASAITAPSTTTPFNIGAAAGDATNNAVNPFYGRIDEAFALLDTLSDDQVRYLYAARVTHTLGTMPTNVSLNITRRRKGDLAATDFPTIPIRLYRFAPAGSPASTGSDTVGSFNAGTPVPVLVSGADGTRQSARATSGTGSVSATDAGLPDLLNPRSYGLWFKTAASAGGLLGYGTETTADARLTLAAGAVVCSSAGDSFTGPFVADGQWHFAVVTEENAPTDGSGVKRKLYLDGRLVGSSLVMNSITLTGTQRFRWGSNLASTGAYLPGVYDTVFVCAYALGQDDVLRLWAKGSQALGPSPKNAGDHVEAIDATSVLAIFDTLESQHTVDIGVAS